MHGPYFKLCVQDLLKSLDLLSDNDVSEEESDNEEEINNEGEEAMDQKCVRDIHNSATPITKLRAITESHSGLSY